MLWYKAWLETRSRFLVCLFGMAVLPSYYVYNESRGVGKLTGLDWYYRALHTGHCLIAVMWVAAVMFLMMGGLLREKALGTSSFTLCLPVSRTRLMEVRILFGLAEAIILAIVPWSAMFVVSVVAGRPTSVEQAAFHLFVMLGGGTVFFAAALLVSSLVEGEYTAPAVSFGMFFVDMIALGDKPFRLISPWTFMLGSEYLDRTTQLLSGPLPWLHATANLALALLLITGAIRVIRKKEF